MSEEIEEIKKTSEEFMKDMRGILKIIIVFAKREETHWKIVVRYETSDNPDMLSMLRMDLKTKKIDYFREGLMSF